MSLSKSSKEGLQDRRGSSSFVPSSLINTPVLTERFDRFCTNCSGVIENMAIEKYEGLKCFRCNHEVEYLDRSDGNYRRCVRCSVFLRCEYLDFKLINFFKNQVMFIDRYQFKIFKGTAVFCY